jgi:hydroxyacylglutathione hydrolase
MKRRAILHALTPRITCIDDAGDSVCYVVCGRDRAAVIDTVNGREDLHAIVRSITDLPLVVINTHGHCDHIYGNVFFEEAFLHPDDWAVHDRHFAMKRASADEDAAAFGMTQEELAAYVAAEPCPLRPIREGEIVDLGGIRLEVVKIAGHTKGSIALLDRDTGFLFSGDAINGQIWLQLPESTKLAVYLESLNALDALRPCIRELHTGHNVEGVPAGYIDEMKAAIGDILKSGGAGDEDYTWFGGDCRRHRTGADSWVLYTPDKL